MNGSRLLAIVVILQLVIVAGQWLGSPSVLSPAMAQGLDAGAQRAQIVDELRAANGKLDRLIGLLESGNAQVRLAPEDKDKKE